MERSVPSLEARTPLRKQKERQVGREERKKLKDESREFNIKQ